MAIAVAVADVVRPDPARDVPAVNGVQYAVVYVVLQVVSQVYLRRSGLMRLLGFGSRRRTV